MNFNSLSGSAKMYKKLQIAALGQAMPSGEVPNIAILCAVDRFSNIRLIENIIGGVKAKGGNVTVVDVPAFGFWSKLNPMTAKYALSFKRVAASNAEAIIKCGLYDGVVIVSDCDITAAGLLEGAARSNCPALIISTGVCAGTSNFELSLCGRVAAGKLNARESETCIQTFFSEFEKLPSIYFNSANTFFILMEAMGLCVPTASTTHTTSPRHPRNAAATGEAIFENAKNVLSPKKFLTRAALGNAIALCLAIGGDISAIYTASELVQIYEKIPHEIIAEFSPKVQLLLEPQAQGCSSIIHDFGIAAILKQLSNTPKLIDETALAYTGEKLKSTLANQVPTEFAPVTKTARIVLAQGSACEDGGYIQPAKGTPSSFQGKAWVYNSLEDADKALTSGSIPDGSVMFVHNCTDTFVTALAYTIEGLERKIAIVTDGLCDKTGILAVTRCTPDSLANESFANIQSGDQIDIDLGRGRINTNASAKDLKIRAKRNSVRKQTVYFQ